MESLRLDTVAHLVHDQATRDTLRSGFVRDLRNTPAQVWTAPESDDLVLTSNGDPVALVVKLADGDLFGTVEALSRARAQQAVSRLREHAAVVGTSRLTEEEIEAEIAATRKERSAP